MNNSPENNLGFIDTKPNNLSENTMIDVLQEKNIDEISTKNVLIKHDYYSTDSDFGRQLLKTYLSCLCNSYYNSLFIYLVDKGTRLLDKTNPLYDDLLNLSRKCEIIMADQDSINEYGVNVSLDSEIPYQTTSSIAEDIIYLSDLLILE